MASSSDIRQDCAERICTRRTVNITDGAAAAWNGLNYSQAENGRRVLYNDLSSGDLTLLTVDMDTMF